MTKFKYKHFWLLIILIAFLVRVYHFSFPAFTSDEARIAYRGYTLASFGKDELGRSLPFLFNSLTDYQLPVVSYFSAIGILLFGKNDFGARIPFMIISILIMVLIYKISKVFNSGKEFRLFSVLIAAFSPILIFLSKIPNETIILTFSLTLLFFLLTKDKINLLVVCSATFFTLLISKNAWFITLPFAIYTLTFFRNDLPKRTRIKILASVFVLVVGLLVIFLQIPQAKRSLLENNFSIFQDTSIRAAENTLRGQGLEAGWPNFSEKILFNKLQFINVGFLTWITQLQPAFLFSQFDSLGNQGFVSMGMFPKILLIPFVMGLIIIVREESRKAKALIFYPLVLTFPLIFTYPVSNWSIVATTLPFITLIISWGLNGLNKFLKYLVISLMVLEVSINLIFLSPEIKSANQARPVWVKGLVEEVYDLSKSHQVAISDDLVPDIVPFLGWFSPIKAKNNYMDIQYPYKFHQMDLLNMRIIGSDDTFYFCGLDRPTSILASKRDLAKIEKWLNIDTSKTVQKKYTDDLNERKVNLLKPTICVH